MAYFNSKGRAKWVKEEADKYMECCANSPGSPHAIMVASPLVNMDGDREWRSRWNVRQRGDIGATNKTWWQLDLRVGDQRAVLHLPIP